MLCDISYYMYILYIEVKGALSDQTEENFVKNT